MEVTEAMEVTKSKDRGSRVIVCVGPGGVGKTTTAAALGIALAEQGQRVVVLTVDPARRLANALGLAELANHPTRVDLPRSVTGSLSALMLDAAATFDDLVRKHAPSTERADTILSNAFYRNISRSLSGTQEYMAMEKFSEVALAPTDSNGTPVDPFDVVIVDTPPTKNGLDLLSSSERLLRLLDNRIFRALMASPRGAGRVIGGAAQLALRPLGRIIGTEVLADAVAFFQAFEGMEDGFRQRSTAAQQLFRGSSSRWVLVTSPQRATVAEAQRLLSELADRGIGIDAVIANRVQPLALGLPKASSVVDSLRNAVERAEAANVLARAQREVLGPLTDQVPRTVTIGLRNTDLHTIAHLRAFAESLGGREERGFVSALLR